ncbi:hypothetical protein JCM3765_007659 [Sporobolomyces pararoseus]
MSTWRGGFKPTFPSTSNHTNGTSNGFSFNSSNNNTSNSTFNSAVPSFAIGERGRGRGRGSRGGSGATRGLPSKRGGGTNLSWKRTEPQLGTQETPQGGEESSQSAFEAFGNNSGGGGLAVSAFGGGFNPTPSTSNASNSTSAFGSGGSAFNSNGGTFGSSTSSSAFPPAPPTSAFSAFGSSSTFAPTPSAFSAPPAQTSTTSIEEEAEEEEEEDVEEETEDNVGETKRNPAQISTLEVLGEDSDARRKRFESTLPNNRYLELKPLREEQRLKAIKQGLIPDPSKPMRLDQATDFEGTCEEMCPEWEREEREYQNNVDPLERYPGTSRIDPSRAVKAFHRPAAGNDQPLPSDVRPPPILYKTLDYLFHTLLPQHPLAVTHPFVRDRTRSVRQDFTVQNVRGHSAIECNERIARYHILALGTLREQSGFSESQELEQLRKVLKSLNEFYDDLRLSNPNVSLPNEAEFRSYHLLTHLRDPDIIWSTELLPPHVFSHPLLQTALQLHRFAQRSNIPRGERASPNAFSRFFKLVESAKVPYLFGCILSTHFNEIRRNALDALKGAYLKQHSAFPLRTLTKLLGCDDELETRSVCEQLGVVVRTDERGKLVAELHKGVVLKSTNLKLRVSRRLVEAKRGSTPYQSVIDGANYSSQAVQKVPTTPWLASASSPSTFPSTQPQSRPAVPAPSFTGFGTSTSMPSTTFPTPVPTPPPFSTSTAALKPSLDATASPFVPTKPSANPPPVSFSFPATSTPSTVPPQQPKATSAFSFAPTAAPFVPSSAPNASTVPSVPNFFSQPPASSSVPSTNSGPPPLAKPKPISPIVSHPLPPPAAAPPTVQPLRRISATLAHTSPKLHHHPPVPVPPKPSPPRVDRKPFIDSLARSLTLEMLTEAIQGQVRRIGGEILKERWGELKEREEEEKRVMGDELAEMVTRELGGMMIREIAIQVEREGRLRREVLTAWKERTQEQKRRRKEGLERKKEWEEVVRGLGSQGRRAIPREEEDEMSDEESAMEEEDDVGLSGDGDVDFELGGLSLSVDKSSRRVIVKDAEEDLAAKLKTAAETRQRIWAGSTFLNILNSHLSHSIDHRRLPSRARWTTLLFTPSTETSFATWLSCKFGLDEEDRRATRATSDTTLAVQMLASEEEPDEDDLDTTGLLIFDCTGRPGADLDWEEAREQLSSLVADVDRDSLYRPTLLVLVCPDRTLDLEEEKTFKDLISQNLNLSSLGDSLAMTSIMTLKLDGAEKAFETETAKLLSSILIREDRIRRPLTSWRTSVKSNLDRFRRDEIASTVVSTYIGELQEIVTEIENVVHPVSADSVTLPSFPDVKGSFRSAVESYSSSSHFANVGHFPELAAAFAQRPPPSDHNLARLLLDLLDQFITTSFPSHLTTLQLSLDTALRTVLERLEDSLVESTRVVRQAAQDLETKLKAQDSTPTKKRKASVTPNDSP